MNTVTDRYEQMLKLIENVSIKYETVAPNRQTHVPALLLQPNNGDHDYVRQQLECQAEYHPHSNQGEPEWPAHEAH